MYYFLPHDTELKTIPHFLPNYWSGNCVSASVPMRTHKKKRKGKGKGKESYRLRIARKF
jgi:hypothetical protein